MEILRKNESSLRGFYSDEVGVFFYLDEVEVLFYPDEVEVLS